MTTGPREEFYPYERGSDWLKEISEQRYEWTMLGEAWLGTELRPGLPWRIRLGKVDRGPVLHAAIGIHGTAHYWQWATLDEAGRPLPRRRAIERLWNVMELIQLASKSEVETQTTQRMRRTDDFPITSPREDARRAAEQVPVTHNNRQALQESLYELCLNVQRWAGAPGFIAVEEDNLHSIITVRDEGAGIPATIRKAFPDLADKEAVAKALSLGGSSSDGQRRREGLASAFDLSARGFIVYLETEDVAAWVVRGNTVFACKGGRAVTGTRIQVICPTGHFVPPT